MTGSAPSRFTLSTSARTEGLRGGLYKGVTMNWVKGPVSVAVSFFVNDSVKAYFRELHETGTYPGMSAGG